MAMAAAQTAPVPAKRILIVEDNALNLKLLTDLCEAQGYETLQAGGGLDAINLAREHLPDPILMDIQLPEASGLEVTRSLNSDPPARSIPVVPRAAFAR